MSYLILTRNWLYILGSVLLFVLFSSGMAQAAQSAAERGVGGIVASGIVQYRASWAVVIGIDRYTKAPRLNYAVNDAKSIVAAVQQLGFASDKILLLLDEEATKQRIEQLLYGTLRRTTAEDRVLVFFAGHGLTSSLPRGGDEGFLLPVDGDPEDLPLTAIAMEDIRKIARRIPAKHVLFAVDACYSGFTITRDVSPTKVDALYLESVTKEPAVQIITAGRKGEQVSEEEGHGLFTRRMLQGLTGPADTDQNGIVTAQELATWLESRVVRDSQDRQHPQYSRLDGEGQFVFVLPGRQQPSVAAVSDERERLTEEVARFRQERALFEEQRKLQEEKQRIELAKLEAERVLLKAEAERLAVEKARTEEARQAVERRLRAEEESKAGLAKLEAERLRFKEEEERLAREKARSEQAQREIEHKRQVEEAAKVELANLEMERARLQAAEERIAKEKARTEEARLEAERKEKGGEASKASQAQVIAQLQPPASISRPPVVLPTVAEMPKYKVGDSWTVRFADGRTSRRIVRAIEKDQYVFEWGLDLWRYYDQNLVLIKQVTPEDGKEVRTSPLRRRTMEFPLAANKTWGFRYRTQFSFPGATQQASMSREFSFKVLGTETINTPAGPFGTFKIEETSYEVECRVGSCQTLDDTLTVHHLWYAPEAKFIVKVAEVRAARYISEHEPDYELIAFDLK